MAVYLVRHAKAGSRKDWHGDDRMRPLSKAGRRQADGLLLLLGHRPVPRIVSSPYLRCTQTVSPLAEKLGLRVEVDERLAEFGPIGPMLELLDACEEHTVLCSHGDLIPETISVLERGGLQIIGGADFRKGACWVLERRDGRWAEAEAWPPSES